MYPSRAPNQVHAPGAVFVRASSLALAMVLLAAPLAPAAAAASGDPQMLFAADAARSLSGLGWYSSNWAGYIVEQGTYRSVAGQWTVPAVAGSLQPTYSALWIGVDGATNQSLVQVGTSQSYYGGSAHYLAWWEILPAPAVPIRTMSVRPGDRMSARIIRVRAGVWRMTIVDTRGGSFTTTRLYSGPGTSAEWIEEAPVVDGQLASLAVHRPTAFDNATANASNPKLAMRDGGAMVAAWSILDVPSPPDADRNGFAVGPTGSVAAPAS